MNCPAWPKTRPVLCKCHSPQCGATLPAVVASLNGEVDFSEVVVRAQSRNGKGFNLAYYAEKTEIPEDFWEELGVYNGYGGIVFPFDDENVVKVRKSEKEFMWVPGKGITPPLWPYPEQELPEHIYITEGESDCGTARYLGLHAFAATKGAQTTLSPIQFQALASRGVLQVTIVTDRGDDVFGPHMAKGATDAGLEVSIVNFDLVVNEFSGAKDLNDIYRACVEEGESPLDVLARATTKVEEKVPFRLHVDASSIAAEERTWAVNELIAPGDKVMIAGPPKAYKTWIALDLVRAMLHAQPFLSRADWAGTRPMKVLLCEEEGSLHAFAQRLARIPTGDLLFMHKAGIAFTDESSISSLIQLCKQQQVDVVVFDPLQRMIPGINENDSAETAIIWNEIFRMQMALPDLIVVVLHHANKSESLTLGSVRGSSRHVGEVDLLILVDKFDKGVVHIRMEGRDTQAEVEGDLLQGKVEITDDDFTINTLGITIATPTQGSGRDKVLRAIEEGCDTRTKIMRHTGLGDTTVRLHLPELIKEGLIDEVANGHKKPRTYLPRNQ